ncbi:MAG: glycosyltransferase family A protein [Lutibacter sp.]|jgi:glycosyltransferase involved in cell wall biosynthesis
MKRFTILITTKDRIEALKYTLQKINNLIERLDVACIICDDGSSDGTFEFVKLNYPTIHLIQNKKSQGLIFSRNRMMDLVKSTFAISLDDDLNFLSEHPLEKIEAFFNAKNKCAVISFRIFWGIKEPLTHSTNQKQIRINSYAGGAHAFRMDAWKEIPNYPSWFVFYGEEDFASYHLFMKKWEIYYLPEILTHHRVDLKNRKKQKDYIQRSRRGLRSGWFLIFMFYPLKVIPKIFSYTLFIQFKNKIVKGDFKAGISIVLALIDVFLNFPRIFKNSKRLSNVQYIEYKSLTTVPLYWKPENES